MKTVSVEYKAGMKETHRKGSSHVQVVFRNVDTSAAADGAWVSNGEAEISEVSTLDYEYLYGNTYAALELNRWTLDGKTDIAPDSNFQDGFISEYLSDESGDFTTTAVLTKEFSESHSLLGLTLNFDTRMSEYPQNVTINCYLDGEAVISLTVKPDSPTLLFDIGGKEVDLITIEFGSMLPYRRARLESVIFGWDKMFDNGDIVSTSQTHDVDPLARRLPTEKFSFTILDYEHNYDPDNPSSVYAYIDTKAPVSIQFGYELGEDNIEWIKADRYVLSAKPTVASGLATFEGTGLIGSLTSMFYKSKLGEKNLYDMAVEVLEDAGLSLSIYGAEPWVIDESLKNMYTTAALPIDTHMNNLHLIAHAARCQLYTDDDNIIHIEPFGITLKGIYSGEWSSNGAEDFSSFDNIDVSSAVGEAYATLELNRWTLDGTQGIISEPPFDYGYASNSLSNSDGHFEVYPTITKVFDRETALQYLALQFDTTVFDYPFSVRVDYYNGTTLLHSVTERVNGTSLIIREVVNNCTSLEISVLDGLPYRRARIEKIYFRESDFVLDFTTTTKDTLVLNKTPELKSLSVAQYSYSAAENISTLFEGTTTETELHVEFSSPAQEVEITVSGGTVIASSIYARAVDLVLGEGEKTISITGKTLTESSVVVTTNVSRDGEADTVENPLITNDTMRQALAQHVIDYLGLRNTYDADYRGNPEVETGDIIGLQTPYTDDMSALVLVDEITFSGALHGKLKVKALV